MFKLFKLFKKKSPSEAVLEGAARVRTSKKYLWLDASACAMGHVAKGNSWVHRPVHGLTPDQQQTIEKNAQRVEQAKRWEAGPCRGVGLLSSGTPFADSVLNAIADQMERDAEAIAEGRDPDLIPIM